MLNRSFLSPALLLAALLAVCLSAAHAQNPPASPAAPAQSQPAATPSPYDAMLAKARKLYYSSTTDGLAGYDCAIHPDWHTLFVSAQKGAAVAEDDPRIVLLKTVGITLHGRLKGSSTMDWNPPAHPATPLDKDSVTLLENMHGAVEQTLQGFMQCWTPFVDGSAIPTNSEGIQITQNDSGYTLHAEQGDTKVTEVIDMNLILQHFDVVLNGTSIKFDPSYKATAKGLLVNEFQAHILPAGTPPEQAQDMQVSIVYQTLDGFPIPARLNMAVVNSGTLNFVMDGCSAIRSSK